MKNSGNGTPETCAINLLKIVRGEVPYDRIRGVSGEFVDSANGFSSTKIDSKRMLEIYEPRTNFKNSIERRVE